MKGGKCWDKRRKKKNRGREKRLGKKKKKTDGMAGVIGKGEARKRMNGKGEKGSVLTTSSFLMI